MSIERYIPIAVDSSAFTPSGLTYLSSEYGMKFASSEWILTLS